MKRNIFLPICLVLVLICSKQAFAENDQAAGSELNPAALKAVEKQIDLFTGNIKERFAVYLSRSGKYVELMKEILRENNIPEDMVFLSLIESGFNPHAYSRSRAVGLWQFIAATGKRYGLRIDNWVDERKDPVKSTWAAARYLNDLYGMFGSWHLAMAAYNAGEGMIFRALKKQKSDDYWDLLDTKYIRSETKNYVPKFIAAKLIAMNPEDFGFTDLQYEQHLKYDEVVLTEPLDLDVIASCAGATVEEIRELNPELKRWCTPPNAPQYTIRIPEGKAEEFWESLSRISEEYRFTPNKEKIVPEKIGKSGKRYTAKRYTIKKGDSLYEIARKTGVSVKSLIAANSITEKTKLRPGAELKIPNKTIKSVKAERPRPTRKASFKGRKKDSQRTIKAEKERPEIES